MHNPTKAEIVSLKAVRIVLSPKQRWHLERMAKDASIDPHVMASRILADVIEEDARAHGLTP
jgi:hypothetical protein